jgi:CheY-like chemotaxis protein
MRGLVSGTTASHRSMNRKILALLEDPKNLEQVSECLERSGHSVLRANRFETAMRILEQQQVDLIVSDVHLQNGGDIFDFLVKVHVSPGLQGVPFVCFSFQPTELAEYLSQGVQTAARMLGATSYISMRIFDPQEFAYRINELLPKRTQLTA